MVSIEIVDLPEEQANRAPTIAGLNATVEVNENQSQLLSLTHPMLMASAKLYVGRC